MYPFHSSLNTRDSITSKYVGIPDYADKSGETEEGSGGTDYQSSGSGSGGSDYDGFSLGNSKGYSMFRSARVGNSLPGTAICNNSFSFPTSQDYFLPEFQGNLDIDDKTIAEMEQRYEPEIKTFDFKMTS